MSAFILGSDHIDFLVTAAISLGTGGGYGLYWQPWDNLDSRTRVGLDNADDFGAMLLAENIASVQYLYNDPTPEASAYRYRPFPNPAYGVLPTANIAQVLKAIRCYEYQSCEHPDWDQSQAKSICTALRDAYINRLPGYDDAQWEVCRPAQPALAR